MKCVIEYVNNEGKLKHAHEKECIYKQCISNDVQKMSISEPILYDRSLISQYLISGDISINPSVYFKYYTVLQKASWEGSLNVVKRVLKFGVNVNLTNEEGNTALHLASWRGNVKVVNEIANYGASLDTTNNEGLTALHLGAWFGHFEVVQRLLDEGASLDFVTYQGNTALHLATYEGEVEIVQLLLERGIVKDMQNMDAGLTALHIACQNGDEEIVRLLTTFGADLDITNSIEDTKSGLPSGNTGLHFAAWNGELGVIKQLLKYGANLDVRNEYGNTALHLAAWYVNMDVVRELINWGAATDVMNNDGFAAIHYVIQYGELEILKIFEAGGADLDITVKDTGYSSLHLACEAGDISIVRTLVKLGVRYNSLSKDGQTALQVAIKAHQYGCAQILESLRLIENMEQWIKDDNVGKFEWSLNDIQKISVINIMPHYLKMIADLKPPNILKCLVKYRTIDQIFSDKLANSDFILEFDFCRALFHSDLKLFSASVTVDFVNRSALMINTSALELAFDSGSELMLMEIMKLLIDDIHVLKNLIESKKNNDIMKCKKQYNKMCHVVKHRLEYLDSLYKSNYNRLDIAAIDGCAMMVHYLLQNGGTLVTDCKDRNIISAALSAALSYRQIETVALLQQCEVNYDTVDQWDQTLLHIAITSKLKVEYFSNLVENWENFSATDYMGLTVMHRTAIDGDNDVCRKLMQKDSNWNRVAEIPIATVRKLTNLKKLPASLQQMITNRENTFLLNIKSGRTIFNCFLDRISDCNVQFQDGEGNTALHIAARLYDNNACDAIINADSQVIHIENNQGFTPLRAIVRQIMDLTESEISVAAKTIVRNLVKAGSVLVNKRNEESHILQLAFAIDE